MMTTIDRKKLAFVLFAHKPLDDRIFYHYAPALKRHGFDVVIISGKEERVEQTEHLQSDSFDDTHLTQRNKIAEAIKRLKRHSPDIIVCDYPIAVIAAKRYSRYRKTPIIYEVTEWYPSKKNLHAKGAFSKIIYAFALFVINMYAGGVSNGYLFGEHYKRLPFALFFGKKRAMIPYYIDTCRITTSAINRHIDRRFNLFYSGLINEEKGVYRLLNAIDRAASKYKNTCFHLTIMGNTDNEVEQQRFQQALSRLDERVKVDVQNTVSFTDYCATVGNYDLYFDLREKDIENNHCLPIKIFIYFACGRPVIYSDLKAIRKGIDASGYGYLVDPTDAERISELIGGYIEDKALYFSHCKQAKALSESEYHWQAIEHKYIDFITSFFK